VHKDDLNRIFAAIESGRCLAFLGAGASTAFEKEKGKWVDGLPGGNALAESLAEKCQYTNGKGNGKDFDLLKVADYFLYYHSGDRRALELVLREEIQKNCGPRPIHTVLAQLKPVKIILTSNYDTLMEEELRKYNRRPLVHVHNPTDSRTGHFSHSPFWEEEEEVVIHKMHGTVDVPGSMVVSQSDYIRYLANLHDMDRGMPEYFRKTIMPYCTLLFLGYSLEDWNFRVIWEGILSHPGHRHQNIDRTAYALVKEPTNHQTKYWARRHIDLYDMDLTVFARKLAAKFNLEIPQLDIRRQEADIVNEDVEKEVEEKGGER